MASAKKSSQGEAEELVSSFQAAPEGDSSTLEASQSNGSQEQSDINAAEEVIEEEGNGAEAEELEEVEEVEEEIADEDAEVKDEIEASEADANEEAATTEDAKDTEKQSEKKDGNEEEEDAEETEESDKKIAEKFDPNQMPQVNVSTLAQRRWQVKVYPLRPSDFMSGQISRVFKQAKESLLYVYTAGNNGRFSNGKAELYMSNIGQAVKVMQNLIKMEFYHPETNIKIIRKNDAGAVIEKASMRFYTKMASLLYQPSGPMRRAGTKRERIIGSVFLKNLPDGATKDMLRVMFPFAAEINFNPEKFKESTARLVLSNRNSVIPCLKAFSKVELGGNILEFRPLEKKKKLEETPKKTTESDKIKSEGAKGTTPSKDNTQSTQVKKEEEKSSTSNTKEAAKKTTQGDDRRKPGNVVKKVDPKRPRGAGTQSSPRGGATNRKYNTLSKFGQQSRWQDRQGFSSTRGGRGGIRSSTSVGGLRGAVGTGGRLSGRGSSFSAGRGGRFGPGGDGGFRSGTSPGRMSGSGMGMSEGHEVTKEMMHLQAQLSMAIKNQITMLNQTQMAVEQAKRGAVASTAAAAAAAMGAGGVGGGVSSSSSGAYSRALDVSQADQYSRFSEQSRRGQVDSSNRQRMEGRNRNRDRRDTFGGRETGRGNRGSFADERASYGLKRSSGRAGFDTDSYEDNLYGKRSSFGLGLSSSSQGGGRSWADESEDLDPYGAKSSLSFGGVSGGGYRGQTSDYADDATYPSAYEARGLGTGSSRAFGSMSSLQGRNFDYSGGSNYDYGY